MANNWRLYELDHLTAWLRANADGYGWKVERKDKEPNEYSVDQHIVIVYTREGERLFDAICHYGSYGYEEGLLEIMGSIVQTDEDSVEGWKTADDIIQRIIDIYG